MHNIVILNLPPLNNSSVNNPDIVNFSIIDPKETAQATRKHFDALIDYTHNSIMDKKILIKTLIHAGRTAPSADNSQPWRFESHGNSLSVIYDFARVQGQTFPANSPATLLSLGATIENITELSRYYGIEADLFCSIESLSTTCSGAKISFQSINSPESTIPPTTHPISERHTNRFAYHKTAVPRPVIDHTAILTENSARLVIIDQKPAIHEIALLIKLASEIRFQTQEVHEWLGKCLRFTKEDVKKADGLDIQTLDLPPGGSVFLKFISSWKRMKLLNRIGAYKLLAQIDSAPIKAAPAIVAIIAPATAQGAIDAGRLLCRAWTYLNTQNIAVHPYYVVADQLARLEGKTVPEKLIEQVQDINQQCTKELSLKEGETLHMFLRAGYPKRNNPTRSLRLPEETVFTDLSGS